MAGDCRPQWKQILGECLLTSGEKYDIRSMPFFWVEIACPNILFVNYFSKILSFQRWRQSVAQIIVISRLTIISNTIVKHSELLVMTNLNGNGKYFETLKMFK